MTTDGSVESAAAPQTASRSRSRRDTAFRLAGAVAALSDHDRGGLAGLRRMNPDEPDTAAFWRIMAEEELLGNSALERKWGLILHGIALMTRTAGGDDTASRSAHNRDIPVGRALFLGGDPNRGAGGYYSESRLNRLLTARDDMLRILLRRMFRMMAASRASFDWGEMMDFILNEERAEEGRRRIARDYFQAERRSSRQSDQQGEEV